MILGGKLSHKTQAVLPCHTDSLSYLHIMGACIRGFLSLDSGPCMPAQLLDIVYETDL